MKICYYARAGQLKFYVAIAKRLAEEGVEYCFVTQHRSESDYVRAQIPSARVHEIEQYLSDRWNEPGNGWQDLENRYENVLLWRMLYVDRFLISYSKEDAVRITRLHFDFFESVFAEERPDYFLNEAVAVLSAYVALEVGRLQGVKYVGTIIARDDARRKFFFVRDVYQRNPILDDLYPHAAPTSQELDDARAALVDFRSKQTSPAYMEAFTGAPRFRVQMVGQFLKYLAVRHSPKYRNPIFYMTYGRARELYAPATRYRNYRKSRSFYCQPVPNDRFYLLPLHFQPEASTLVCAPKYEKQLVAIDHIAKSLPADTVLYVKEHYAALGSRDPSFYAQLANYPNVRLIDPLVDVHDLIVTSRAVIVLTSTTGFEALLYGKKVFVLGNVFYDRFENVERVEDVFASPASFRRFAPTVGDDSIVRFLATYRRSLYPGCVSPAFSEFLSAENVRSVAAGLLRYVGEGPFDQHQ